MRHDFPREARCRKESIAREDLAVTSHLLQHRRPVCGTINASHMLLPRSSLTCSGLIVIRRWKESGRGHRTQDATLQVVQQRVEIL